MSDGTENLSSKVAWNHILKTYLQNMRQVQIMDMHGDESTPVDKKSTIRKIVISGHGRPGCVEDVGVVDIAKRISRRYGKFGEKVEVHFSSCMVGGNEAGRAKVKQMAKEMGLVSGSTITVNRVISINDLLVSEHDGKDFFIKHQNAPIMLPLQKFAGVLAEARKRQHQIQTYSPIVQESLPGGKYQKKFKLDYQKGQPLTWTYEVP